MHQPVCPDAAAGDDPAQLSPELADVFRRYGEKYALAHPLPQSHRNVMSAIEACRTATLGGRVEECDHCNEKVILYNSCGNRHCPKCGAMATARWLEARLAEVLPVPYFHGTFTIPHELNPLIRGNKKVALGILFKAVSETLLQFGRTRGGLIGITAVLHTWDQKLNDHFHIHCLIPAGMLSLDRSRWIPIDPKFLFPVRALSSVFRAKFLAYLEQAFAQGKLIFPGKTASLARPDAFARLMRQVNGKKKQWVVDCRPPFAGPETVVDYLARYTYRIAISSNRILDVSDGQVTFKYKDRKDNNATRTVTLDAGEFMRRFLLHVLPDGFQRVRHYGLFANRNKKHNLARCRELLGVSPPPQPAGESMRELMLRIAGFDIAQCPHCKKGTLRFVSTLSPQPEFAPSFSPFTTEVYDTS